MAATNPSEGRQGKADSLIRHELLNLLTLIQFCGKREESENEAGQEDKMQDWILWAGFLISQPESFAGKKAKCLAQETELEELMEIAVALGQGRIVKKGSAEGQWIQTDKGKAKDLLWGLAHWAWKESKGGTVEIKPEDGGVFIRHKKRKALALPRFSPMDCLQKAQLTAFERWLCMILRQGEDCGMEVSSLPGKIMVLFRKPPTP